ncbi:hypothetical protein [Dyadobacter bucti]|uniref:hypothetical protein n=1 Tax=Dyadobacter bucti TaxID=2572203 RepID=UPI003F7302FE
MSILKLEENKNELSPNNQNCVVNIPEEALLCIWQNYNFYFKEGGKGGERKGKRED